MTHDLVMLALAKHAASQAADLASALEAERDTDLVALGRKELAELALTINAYRTVAQTVGDGRLLHDLTEHYQTVNRCLWRLPV